MRIRDLSRLYCIVRGLGRGGRLSGKPATLSTHHIDTIDSITSKPKVKGKRLSSSSAIKEVHAETTKTPPCSLKAHLPPLPYILPQTLMPYFPLMSFQPVRDFLKNHLRSFKWAEVK